MRLPWQQLEVIEKTIIETLSAACHDFLFALQERNDLYNDIQLLVDGNNLAEESDGLQGELFSVDGWIQSFSAYADKAGN